MAFSFKKRLKKDKKEAETKNTAERVPPKGKVFRAAKGTRFVFFIGDEGAILVYIKDNQVLSRQFCPDASEQNLEELKQTIEKDPKAPVLLVIDSMDQSYVQQTLPPVSAMSVGKLVKRRLDRDFGPEDIKGAMILGREKTGRKDWNFMMIALERSPQLSVWLDFVMELPNRFKGIHLISAETEIFLKTLEKAIGVPKEGTGAEWKFFVSHNKVGGFRQVILHKGKIVFTRLAQPLGETNTEVITGSIEQEILSTIEYMKRLSYNPQAGLDIYILASAGIKDAIDTQKFSASSTQVFTPFEMAQFFNIEGATQATDQFGDVVLASIIGCAKRHRLTLAVPEYKKIDTAFNLKVLLRLVTVVGTVGMIGYSGYMGADIMGISGDLERLERQKKTEQNTLTALKNEIARKNLDVEKATDLIDLYKYLQEENDTLLPLIEKIKPLIVPPMTLKSISIQVDKQDGRMRLPRNIDPVALQRMQTAKAGDSKNKWVTVTLVVELPAVVSDSKARRFVLNRIMGDFRRKLPGYEVEAEKSLADIERAGRQLSISSANEAIPMPGDITNAEPVEETLMIYGPLVPAPEEPVSSPSEGNAP